MSVTDELIKLQQLRDAGTIDDHEFAAAKARLLGEFPVPPVAGCVTLSEDEIERQTRLWAFALHLSQYAGYAFPFVGFIAPVVIWQIKKDELPLLDVHGKNCVNWIISKIIYGAISGLLCFFVIGIPMLIALIVCAFIFPIIAAIKANNGEVWKYPGATTFLS